MDLETTSSRRKLREACKLYGGIRPVARAVGISDGNLSRWFKGGKTLSASAVASVMNALGLPGSTPDHTTLHLWHFHWQGPGFKEAIALYFPDGAAVARAPWSRWNAEALFKQLSLSGLGLGQHPPEIFALSDGKVKAVVYRTPGYPMVPQDFGSRFSWRSDDVDLAVLDLSRDRESWLNGEISITEFNSAWGQCDPTLADLGEFIQRSGMSMKKALAILKKHGQKN